MKNTNISFSVGVGYEEASEILNNLPRGKRSKYICEAIISHERIRSDPKLFVQKILDNDTIEEKVNQLQKMISIQSPVEEESLEKRRKEIEESPELREIINELVQEALNKQIVSLQSTSNSIEVPVIEKVEAAASVEEEIYGELENEAEAEEEVEEETIEVEDKESKSTSNEVKEVGKSEKNEKAEEEIKVEEEVEEEEKPILQSGSKPNLNIVPVKKRKSKVNLNN